MRVQDYKILIVDDEKDILYLIEKILRKDGFTRIFLATSMEEGLREFERNQPNCCIFDVMLPDGDGFELLQSIRKHSKVPVLFLSARGENEDRILGLGLGADDYIVKPFVPKELTLRLRAILGRVYQSELYQEEEKPVFLVGNTEVDLNQGIVKKQGNEQLLTAKEYALLSKLYENRNKIVTYDNLCQAVWGDGYYGYENTLMVHIRRLREKIEEEPSKPVHIKTVRGLGYQLKL